MTTKEIIQLERDHIGHLVLHREGLFIKAYEESAFRLSAIRQEATGKPLKATRRFIRQAGRDIISVSLSVEAAASLLSSRVKITETSSLTVYDDSIVDEAAFRQWRESVPLRERSEGKRKARSGAKATLAQMIAGFDLAGSTPTDCQQFIVQLKAKL